MQSVMPRYLEPGVILSEIEYTDKLCLTPAHLAQAGALFEFCQSITFDKYIIYAGTIAVLDSASMSDYGWHHRLQFKFGKHDNEPIEGFIEASIDSLSQYIKPVVSSINDTELVYIKSGDMLKLLIDLPLGVLKIKAGSVIFIVNIGDYSDHMDYVEAAFLYDGSPYDIMIQVNAICKHMSLVSSIDDAYDDG